MTVSVSFSIFHLSSLIFHSRFSFQGKTVFALALSFTPSALARLKERLNNGTVLTVFVDRGSCVSNTVP
jgi:hypothetical protein